MNTQQRIEMINDLTIELVKAQVRNQQINDYLANGGDPKDLNKQCEPSKLPVEPF